MAGAGAFAFGWAAICQYLYDQRNLIVCDDCGAIEWLEAEECHTCLDVWRTKEKNMNDYIDKLAREIYNLWLHEIDGLSLEDVAKHYAAWLPDNNYAEILVRAKMIQIERLQ